MNNKPRVFIVEDASFLREMLYRVFTLAGIEVLGMVGSGGEQAFSKIKGLKPDVVLVDLVLPRENGLSLIHKINQMYDETKVIVCSSLQTEYVRTQSELAGAMYFINKPFKSDEMVKAVFSAVKQEEQMEMVA